MLKYACEQQGGKCIITYVLLGAGVCAQACLCENGIGSIVASSPTVRTTNVLFRATRFSLEWHGSPAVLCSAAVSLSPHATHRVLGLWTASQSCSPRHSPPAQHSSAPASFGTHTHTRTHTQTRRGVQFKMSVNNNKQISSSMQCSHFVSARPDHWEPCCVTAFMLELGQQARATPRLPPLPSVK